LAATTLEARPDAEAVRRALEDRETVIRLLGLDKVRVGPGRLTACCPVHEDSHPSFSMSEKAGRWVGYCHACGAGGDALGLFGKRIGIDPQADFPELLSRAGTALGISPGPERAGRSRTTTTPPRVQKATPAPARDADLEERREMQERIHRVLLDVAPMNDEGRAYLRRRGFRDEEIPTDWCVLPELRDQHTVVRAIMDEIGRDAWIERSGMVGHAGRPMSWPQHRLVIPWCAEASVQSQVAMLQRRLLDDSHGSIDGHGGKKRVDKYVSPAVLAKPPWPWGVEDAEVTGPGTVLVIAEGAIDALALRLLARERDLDWWPVGIPGVRNWRKEWATLGAGRPCIVALDTDEAGESRIAELAAELDAAGCDGAPTRRRPVAGKDWAETLLHLRQRGGADDDEAAGDE